MNWLQVPDTIQVFLERGIEMRSLDYPVKKAFLLSLAYQSVRRELEVTGHWLSPGLVLMVFCDSSLMLSLLYLLKYIVCALPLAFLIVTTAGEKWVPWTHCSSGKSQAVLIGHTAASWASSLEPPASGTQPQVSCYWHYCYSNNNSRIPSVVHGLWYLHPSKTTAVSRSTHSGSRAPATQYCGFLSACMGCQASLRVKEHPSPTTNSLAIAICKLLHHVLTGSSSALSRWI